MTTARPLSIAFHIGAHKTATTHLQVSLDAAAEALAEKGVRYYGPERFRLPGRSLQALFGLRSADDGAVAKRTPAAQLESLAKGAPRLVLSEENFIGPLNYPKGGAMRLRYKTAATRLGDFAAAIEQEIEVFLCLRQPTRFLNSAYCQSLMGGQVMPVATYLDRNPVSSVDWLHLVTTLSATPGIGPITVWRYEDYRPLFGRIIAALVGEEAAGLVQPHGRQVNRGLSAQGVAEVLHRADDAQISLPASAARYLLSVELGYPPFDGFTASEHAESAAHYADQVDQIAELRGATVLRPDPPAKST